MDTQMQGASAHRIFPLWVEGLAKPADFHPVHGWKNTSLFYAEDRWRLRPSQSKLFYHMNVEASLQMLLSYHVPGDKLTEGVVDAFVPGTNIVCVIVDPIDDKANWRHDMQAEGPNSVFVHSSEKVECIQHDFTCMHGTHTESIPCNPCLNPCKRRAPCQRPHCLHTLNPYVECDDVHEMLQRISIECYMVPENITATLENTLAPANTCLMNEDDMRTLDSLLSADLPERASGGGGATKRASAAQ